MTILNFSVNYLDVAPQHASVLMGLGNTVGTLPGILSPIISGYIVTTPVSRQFLYLKIQLTKVLLDGTRMANYFLHSQWYLLIWKCVLWCICIG